MPQFKRPDGSVFEIPYGVPGLTDQPELPPELVPVSGTAAPAPVLTDELLQAQPTPPIPGEPPPPIGPGGPAVVPDASLPPGPVPVPGEPPSEPEETPLPEPDEPVSATGEAPDLTAVAEGVGETARGVKARKRRRLTPAQQRELDLAGVTREKEAALRAGYEADIKLLQNKADVEAFNAAWDARHAKWLEEKTEEVNRARREELARLDREEERIANRQIDPARVWKRSGFLGQALAIATGAIMGYLDPKTGIERSSQLINKIIDRDIKLQTEEIEREYRALKGKKGSAAERAALAEKKLLIETQGRILRKSALLVELKGKGYEALGEKTAAQYQMLHAELSEGNRQEKLKLADRKAVEDARRNAARARWINARRREINAAREQERKDIELQLKKVQLAIKEEDLKGKLADPEKKAALEKKKAELSLQSRTVMHPDRNEALIVIPEGIPPKRRETFMELNKAMASYRDKAYKAADLLNQLQSPAFRSMGKNWLNNPTGTEYIKTMMELQKEKANMLELGRRVSDFDVKFAGETLVPWDHFTDIDNSRAAMESELQNVQAGYRSNGMYVGLGSDVNDPDALQRYIDASLARPVAAAAAPALNSGQALAKIQDPSDSADALVGWSALEYSTNIPGTEGSQVRAYALRPQLEKHKQMVREEAKKGLITPAMAAQREEQLQDTYDRLVSGVKEEGVNPFKQQMTEAAETFPTFTGRHRLVLPKLPKLSE